MEHKSKVLKSQGLRWPAVEAEAYQPDGAHFQEVTRQVLLGEGEGEHGVNFITRYFEIEPGGYSSLERHSHTHSVIVLRGRGKVLLEDEAHDLAPFDCVYVGPDSLHQFHAAGDEPLGFLCMVDRERGPSRHPSDEEVAELRSRPGLENLLKR